MLTEGHVIEAVCQELRRRGYTIVGTSTVSEQGDDIVAEKGRTRLVIEAKGAGSSKPGTARYGKEFNRAQCSTTSLKPS